MNKSNEDMLIKIKSSLERNTDNSIMTREKCLLQQKILNQLISKYKHKAYLNNNKYNKKERNSSYTKTTCPSVSITSYPYSSMNNQNHFMINKSKHKQNIKEKMTKLKLQIEIKKKEQAKTQKKAMIILNDNIKLYQEQLMQEKVTIKKIVDIRKRMMNKSINQYKKLKDNYYKLMNNFDINKYKKTNHEKERELNFWKNQSNKRFGSSQSLFLTLKPNIYEEFA